MSAVLRNPCGVQPLPALHSGLIQLEGFLSGMCCSCEAVYRVLYWENPTVSSQFYGVLLCSVCILYLLPLCWVLAILNSTLFLGNRQFYRVVIELKASLEQWQRPLCSLLACLGLNVLLLTLGQAAWFSLLALLVVLPALLGYLQETCRARPSEPELVRRRFYSVRREDLRRVQLSRQEAIAQVKGFLIQLEGFLSGMCCSCEAVYRVLYWENPTVSSQFYGVLLCSVCILYLLPLCWVLAILNSTLFLGNRQFYRVVIELKASLEQCVGTKPLETTCHGSVHPPLDGAWGYNRTSSVHLLQDLTPGSVEEAEEAEPDEEFKDAIEEDDESSQCSADFDLSLPDNGFMSKNEVIRSKVSRLTERLRKRYPSNNFGSCTGCAATFSVLKKRRSCSNCGNSFCSRCCSFKVPKAVMGATAPEAQRETVFVCALCNQVLTK
ncbi:PREDICTED: protrudin [Chaetura pelagica]|uniref:protrudin n=1 Tax=Chaetura pelagica TaxID=8897 RepID=UPI000523645F|nr:PREDICTED: protrudin [Chaetura pelagica]